MKGYFTIDIICSNGRIFSIGAGDWQKVSDIKKSIAGITYVSANDQRLSYKETIMDDDRTLHSYGIQAHHVIHVEILDRPGLTLFGTTPPSNTTTSKLMEEKEEKILIEIVCSDRYHFSVASSVRSKVADFKNLLARIIDLPAKNQRLSYKGIILEDDQTLSSYGLQVDHAIHVKAVPNPLFATTPPSNTTTGYIIPTTSQMMQSFLSNPQFMKLIADQNPQLHGMLDSYSQLKETTQNPEPQMLQQMTSSPELNQQSPLVILQPGATAEREQLMKERDSFHQEALLLRSDLAKAREGVVILEGAVVRADEKVRVKEAEAEAAIKEATEKETAARKENQELLAYINVLQLQLQRQEENAKQVLEERGESCSEVNTQPLTKHVHLSEENVDKACLSVSRNIQVSERSLVHPPPSVDQTRPINDGEWNDIVATEARISDVREIAPDTEGNSLDIPVFVQPNDGQGQEGNAYHPDVHTFGPPDDTQTEQSTDSYHQP